MLPHMQNITYWFKIHIDKVFVSEEIDICTSTQLEKSSCNKIFFMGVHYLGHPARKHHHVNIIVHCFYITWWFTSQFGENFTIFMGNWKKGASPISQHLTLWQSRAYNNHTYHLLKWSAILWLFSLYLFLLGKFLQMADPSNDKCHYWSIHVTHVSPANTLKDEKNKKHYFHDSVAFHILEHGIK